MVKTRKDYIEYRSVERFSSNGGSKLREWVLPPPSFAYVKCLRKLEYHSNSTGLYHLILMILYYIKWYFLNIVTGITIPRNVCAKGLTLYHHGSIVVNQATRIGENCCIMNNVNIGANQGSTEAPLIGNNVYIGPGAVLFGNIIVADGCYIGANSVVSKSITSPNSVAVGAPAKVIKKDLVPWWVKNKLNR